MRSGSWRRTSSASARRSASWSRRPVMPYENGMAYTGLPGSSASTNQSRSCANVTGRSPSRGTGWSMTPSPAAAPCRADARSRPRARKDRRSKTARSGSSTPRPGGRARRRGSRAASAAQVEEVSSAPTRSQAQHLRPHARQHSSVGVRGASTPLPPTRVRTGKDLRSSFRSASADSAPGRTNAAGPCTPAGCAAGVTAAPPPRRRRPRTPPAAGCRLVLPRDDGAVRKPGAGAAPPRSRPVDAEARTFT